MRKFIVGPKRAIVTVNLDSIEAKLPDEEKSKDLPAKLPYGKKSKGLPTKFGYATDIYKYSKGYDNVSDEDEDRRILTFYPE